MFSKPAKSVLHKFTVRLSLWYATLFTLSAGVLFGLLYFLLGFRPGAQRPRGHRDAAQGLRGPI